MFFSTEDIALNQAVVLMELQATPGGNMVKMHQPHYPERDPDSHEVHEYEVLR